jgi:hypothetical protein
MKKASKATERVSCRVWWGYVNRILLSVTMTIRNRDLITEFALFKIKVQHQANDKKYTATGRENFHIDNGCSKMKRHFASCKFLFLQSGVLLADG